MSADPIIKASFRPTPTRTIAVAPGFYRHYKGTVYRVLGTGWHSETEEELVFYHQADDVNRMFARPVTQFTDAVNVAGAKQPRYACLRALDFKGDTYV